MKNVNGPEVESFFLFRVFASAFGISYPLSGEEVKGQR